MYEKYTEAGRIAGEALKRAVEIVHEERMVLDICEELEDFIIKRGARPAFPVNISQNEEAAHYTARYDDDRRIKKGSLVKVDLGVHVDGYIADAAITLSFSGIYTSMVRANYEALERALSIIKDGLEFYEFGSYVEKLAKGYGFKPIENLMGHRLDRYVLHTGDSVPMIGSPVKGRFRSQNAYAIEPFFVEMDAMGFVIDGQHSNIYRLVAPRKVKDESASQLVDYIWKTYRTLPFASRWIIKEFGPSSVTALERLVKENLLEEYYTLVEAGGAPVAQFEHTVYVDRDKVTVTTRIP
ncbi:MAG: type II methionyl aminopeptidase [Nitrososphaeria archaeon]